MSIGPEVRGDGRCGVPSCQDYDFLPVKCAKCSGVFCSEHSGFESHRCRGHHDRKVPDCPMCGQMVILKGGVDPDTAVMRHIDAGCPRESAEPPTVTERFNFCSHAGCRTNEHVPIICRECGNQYCIEHRNEDAHNCRSLRKESAPQAPRPLPPPPSASTTTSSSSRPAEQASPAGGGAPGVSLGYPGVRFQNAVDKPYVLKKDSSSMGLAVHFPPGSRVSPCYVRIPKSWSIGKLLDGACSKGGCRNDNNKVGPELRIRAFSLMSFDELQPSARADCVLNEGDAVLLCRLQKLPDEVMAEAMHFVWPLDRGSGSASAGASGKWSCPCCTLENPATASTCTLCGAKR